jgi:Arc/MetJ-type ribon-helix-helix transcriptional regulator
MDEKSSSSERIVKVPFPVSLIRRMDEAVVAGYGGFRTRAELMREAVENILNELQFPEAPPEPGRPAEEQKADAVVTASSNGRQSGIEEIAAALPPWERDELSIGDLAGTTLVSPAAAPQLIRHGAVTSVDQPLLGLHNRDYVSIWAVQRLARYTEDRLMPFDDFVRRVTDAAWYFATRLQLIESRDASRKLTVLFPTNTAKRPSAERGFQHFALGTVGRVGSPTELVAGGPLFAWQAIQLASEDNALVGLTEDGWQLLDSLAGLSLDLPHAPELMERFLDHLAVHTPADRWGFDRVLEVVADGPDRAALVASFAASHPEWTPAMASSVAQGYVARSREWGLVEPKLVESRYWLTDVGRDRLRANLQQNTPANAARGEASP